MLTVITGPSPDMPDVAYEERTVTNVPMPDLYEESWDPTGDTLYQWLDDISNRYPKATVSARRVQEAINRERQLDIPQLMDDLLADILKERT